MPTKGWGGRRERKVSTSSVIPRLWRHERASAPLHMHHVPPADQGIHTPSIPLMDQFLVFSQQIDHHRQQTSPSDRQEDLPRYHPVTNPPSNATPKIYTKSMLRHGRRTTNRDTTNHQSTRETAVRSSSACQSPLNHDDNPHDRNRH